MASSNVTVHIGVLNVPRNKHFREGKLLKDLSIIISISKIHD